MVIDERVGTKIEGRNRRSESILNEQLWWGSLIIYGLALIDADDDVDDEI